MRQKIVILVVFVKERMSIFGNKTSIQSVFLVLIYGSLKRTQEPCIDHSRKHD